MKICDEFEEQIKQSKKSSEQLMQAILYNAFNPDKQNNKSNIVAIVPIIEKRAILDAEIKSRLHKKKNFGAVKNEKILYLCETHLELDLGGKYERRPAGPHDPSDRYQVEEILLAKKWFTYNTEKYSENAKKIWTHAENYSEIKEWFETCFVKEKSKIEEIIDIFKDKDTEVCEAIATLYAVWNDFLIDKKDVSDDDIVNDFRNNWDDSKKKFKVSDLKDYLIWMRDKGLIPRGQGTKTIKLDGKQLQLVSKK
jgi:type I restriction enzyme S subunit